jgi:NDP-sugar pyrophosphorylase family protein
VPPPRQALVLTAGLGTRLRPLTLVRAKAAVPVAGEPLVRRIIAWLARNDVTDVVLNLHHLPETIAAVVGDGSDLGVRVRYSWEQPIVLGSAGGPRRALPMLGASTFLIVNGDTLTDVDLPALAAAHAQSGALATLALVPNAHPLKYGGVKLDAESRVAGFVPRGHGAAGSFHFIGVQIVDARLFESVPPDLPVNTIGGIYDDVIAADPGCIRGFVSDAAFWDIGTVSDYWITSAFFGGGRPHLGRDTRVHPASRIDGSILWDDVEVPAGAVLDQCVVADAVVVPAGGQYRRSALVQIDGRLTVTPFENW